MILHIHQNDSLAQLQKQFTAAFPYLHLQFYRKAHKTLEGSFSKYQYPADTMVADIRNKQDIFEMEYKGSDLTSAFEQQMEKEFGLHVQVYRRHGAEWIQTVGTDQLSLHEQNLLGEHAAVGAIHPGEGDYIERRNY